VRLGQSHRFDPVTCPYCSTVLDGQAQIDGDDLPDPGSIAVCLYCSMISVFIEGPALRKPTDEEQAEFDVDKRLQYLRFVTTMTREGIGPGEGFPKRGGDG
jgi:hypothetical protein